MSTLHRKPISVYGIMGANLPKPPRPFGQGIIEADLPACGAEFWTDELAWLESLLPHCLPARQREIHRRIDGVLDMLGIPIVHLDTERDAQEWDDLHRELGPDMLPDWEEPELCRCSR